MFAMTTKESVSYEEEDDGSALIYKSTAWTVQQLARIPHVLALRAICEVYKSQCLTLKKERMTKAAFRQEGKKHG